MAGWTPIFSTLCRSSIWAEKHHVRVAWITILSNTDKDGLCRMSHRVGLMTAGNMTMEEADDAISVLTAPDENSSNPDNEGRRIEKVVGGWRVLNWQYYRQLAMSEAAREAAAQRQMVRRAKKPPEEPVDEEPSLSPENQRMLDNLNRRPPR